MKNKWFARLFAVVGISCYILAGRYLDSCALPTHYDPFLEWLPQIDVCVLNNLALFGLYIFAAYSLLPFLNSRKETEFMTLVGLFGVVRTILCLAAFFGPPPGFMESCYTAFSNFGFLFRNDFFFSGHVSTPFLFFLFFEGKLRKVIFLLGTIAMAAGVLFLHQHYLIDVLSAIPIVFGIYSFNHYILFKKECS